MQLAISSFCGTLGVLDVGAVVPDHDDARDQAKIIPVVAEDVHICWYTERRGGVVQPNYVEN